MVCFRYLLKVSGAGLASAGLVVAGYPGGPAAAARDLLDAPRLAGHLAAADARRRQIEARGAVLAERIAFKDALVGELVAGRTTLGQVAGRFAALNAAGPALPPSARPPAADEDERTARSVMELVQVRDLPDAEKGAVMGRLEGEYARRFGHPCDLSP